MKKLILTIGVLCSVAFSAKTAVIEDVSFQCSSKECYLEFDFSQGSLPSYFQQYQADKSKSGAETAPQLKIGFGAETLPAEAGLYEFSGKDHFSALDLRQSVIRGQKVAIFSFDAGKLVSSASSSVKLEKDNRFRIFFAPSKETVKWKLSGAERQTQASAKEKIGHSEDASVPSALSAPSPAVALANESPQKSASKPDTLNLTKKSATPDRTGPADTLLRAGCLSGFGYDRCFLEFNGSLDQAEMSSESDKVILLTPAVVVIPRMSQWKSVAIASFPELKVISEGKNTGFEFEVKPGVRYFTSGNRFVMQRRNSESVPGLSRMMIGSDKVERNEYKLAFPEDETEGLDSFAQAQKKEQSASMNNVFALSSGVKPVVVTSKQAAIYNQTSADGDTIRLVNFGDRLRRLRVEGPWYQVESGGKTGFIHKRWVSYENELTSKQRDMLAAMQTPSQPASANESKSQNANKTTGSAEEDLFSFSEEMDDRVNYNSFGRRDPFVRLDGPSEEGVNIDGVQLVGIIWDAEEPMVLLSDLRNPGVSYTLKEQDKILNGKVLEITRSEVMFLIEEFGVSRKYTMVLPDGPGGQQ